MAANQQRGDFEIRNVNPQHEVFVRFQIPSNGQSTRDANITQVTWNTTESDVASTIENYYNENKRNKPLWLEYNLRALQYAGVYKSKYLLPMQSQTGLDKDDVSVSLIVPRSIRRGNVEKVTAKPRDDWNDTQKNAAGFIIGLKGTLHPTDLVYTDMATLKDGIKEAKKTGWIVISANDTEGRWVTLRLEALKE